MVLINNRVFLNSFPKGGTNLLGRVLDLFGYKKVRYFIGRPEARGVLSFYYFLISHSYSTNDSIMVGLDMPISLSAHYISQRFKTLPMGSYVRGHTMYSEYMEFLLKENDIPALLIIRDPKDIVVSHVHHICKMTNHPLHQYYTQNLKTFKEQLAFSITGGKVGDVYLNSIAARMASLGGWFDRPGVLMVRFEELVGESGGGQAQKQREILEKISAFLELNVSDSPGGINNVQKNLFGHTSTFRKGQIGSWKETFDPEIEHLYNQTAGHLLERWGYA